MARDVAELRESPSQTAGPYVHIGLTPNLSGIKIYRNDLGTDMIGPDTPGERVTLTGFVRDGTGTPVADALIEIWQADAAGHYAGSRQAPATPDPHFTGWGRCATDMDDGRYTFETIKPGPVPGPGGPTMAPHITFWIVARGINTGLHTRMYFSDEVGANDADPLLGRIASAHRIATLIGERRDTSAQPVYHFDIHLQGEHETVFLDI